MITITVLEEDAEKAMPCVADMCLVAVAIQRQLRITDVEVQLSQIRIQDSLYLLCDAGKKLIHNYDGTLGDVEGITFPVVITLIPFVNRQSFVFLDIVNPLRRYVL